jgi:hypothetical protein
MGFLAFSSGLKTSGNRPFEGSLRLARAINNDRFHLLKLEVRPACSNESMQKNSHYLCNFLLLFGDILLTIRGRKNTGGRKIEVIVNS